MDTQNDLFGELLEAFENDDVEKLERHFGGDEQLVSDGKRRFAEPEVLKDINEAEYLRLADGLLESTIREAFGESRGGKPFRESRQALNWLLYDDPLDEVYPFSYRNCCKAAGVDPDELRDQLVMMKHRLS